MERATSIELADDRRVDQAIRSADDAVKGQFPVTAGRPAATDNPVT
jgi:hypothetical protein